MLTCYLVIVLILVLIMQSLNQSLNEGFLTEDWLNKSLYLWPPIRYQKPTLYPSTAPVDMLLMKKGLIIDGYRFQNSLFPVQSQDPTNSFDTNHNYWKNFHQRNAKGAKRTILQPASFASGAVLLLI